MSEYQYYEFRSIDRPLTEKEQNEIGSWSSRTNPSPTGAVFVYNYGDFRKDVKKVVEKYFDAMFYIAIWGTKRLMFKFPVDLIDPNTIEQYCTHNEISIYRSGGYVLLDLYFSEEEVCGWVEGEGWLSSLISLRNDILRGDYRCLYLAWLFAVSSKKERKDFDE